MIFTGEAWGDMYRSGYHAGVSHVHHFWTPRNLAVLADLWSQAEKSKQPSAMKFLLTSFMVKTGSRLHNIGMKSGRVNLAGQIFNTLQIPSVFAERNLFRLAERKILDLSAVLELDSQRGFSAVSTSSASAIDLPSGSVDYIFVDPPFGGNIMYSEMSFLYEAWLGVFTAREPEAIVSRAQEKTVEDYLEEMQSCFRELHRVLKPGRWITVAFHNSSNAIWNVLQESMRTAGYVIADVRVLDKGQGTFKQMTTLGAVEKDLVITAYKCPDELEIPAAIALGEESAWSFVSEHLLRLPVVVKDQDAIEVLQERTRQLLFDRMVAFHVVRNLSIPISAKEFYEGLADRYPERDGMYFLSEQVAEYDRRRLSVRELRQLFLFPNDEATAIQWLRQQLERKPQRQQDLTPLFHKEIHGWAKHEKTIDIRELLKQSFLRYEGKGLIPHQIVSYLKQSSAYRPKIQSIEEHLGGISDSGLETNDQTLIEAATGLWYVPDPNRQGDLEKARERQLLREFEEYRDSKRRKLKEFRTEAVRAGFKAAYDEQDYKTILEVGEKLPDKVLQEDEKLLMYYDVASMRAGEE